MLVGWWHEAYEPLGLKNQKCTKASASEFWTDMIFGESLIGIFYRRLTNKSVEFKDGNIKEYLGDIDFYLEQRKVRGYSSNRKKNKTVVQKKGKAQGFRHVNFEDQKRLKIP